MDLDALANSTSKPAQPRKVRFAPKKSIPKREPTLVLPKAEKNENDVDDAKAEQLLRKLNEISVKRKVERKAPTELPFGYGGSSSSIRSYSDYKIKKNQGSSSNGDDENVVKEYKEPWDYYTNYPVTLPIRRPYAGNPELLDQEEFGEGQQSSYDENETNTAEDLGLLDEDTENNMFFLQLPETLPAIMQSVKTEANGQENNAKNTQGSGSSKGPCSLQSMPAGLMSKMLVYRSGIVKLKLGDTLYDVSTGLDCTFAQDVVAINAEDKHCCNLGEISKRAVVTPDIDSILDAINDL